MPCNLFPHAYEKLVDEDIEWLKANAPDSLERDHITGVLEFSKREYRLRGYDEAMSRTGPHHAAQGGTPRPVVREHRHWMVDAIEDVRGITQNGGSNAE